MQQNANASSSFYATFNNSYLFCVQPFTSYQKFLLLGWPKSTGDKTLTAHQGFAPIHKVSKKMACLQFHTTGILGGGSARLQIIGGLQPPYALFTMSTYVTYPRVFVVSHGHVIKQDAMFNSVMGNWVYIHPCISLTFCFNFGSLTLDVNVAKGGIAAHVIHQITILPDFMHLSCSRIFYTQIHTRKQKKYIA